MFQAFEVRLVSPLNYICKTWTVIIIAFDIMASVNVQFINKCLLFKHVVYAGRIRISAWSIHCYMIQYQMDLSNQN